MNLVDDMTAAAVDRSPHGYINFLQLRKELVSIIDAFYKEDHIRSETVKKVMNDLNAVLPGLYKNQ